MRHTIKYNQYSNQQANSLVSQCKNYSIKFWLRDKFGMFQSKSLYHFDFSKLSPGDTIISGHLYGDRNTLNPVPLMELPDTFTVNYKNKNGGLGNFHEDLVKYCTEKLCCNLEIEEKTHSHGGNPYYTILTIVPNKSLIREKRFEKILD